MTMKMKKILSMIFMAAITMTTAFNITASAAASGPVIYADDGWVLYKGEDNNIIQDFQGTNLFSLTQLESLRQNLGTFRDTLSSHGTEFIIFIAPNREQVYSDKMPSSYGPLTSYTRAQQVCDYLTSAGFRVVYPIDELKEAVEDYPGLDFYYRTDTHWDELGAYVGAKALMAELGIEMPSIDELSIVPMPHESQDISNLIGQKLTDTRYDVAGYADRGIDTYEDIDLFIHHTTKEGMDDRKVLLAGDSFLLALYPYVSQEFSDVTACNDKTLDIPGLMESVEPNIYIYEVIERFLDTMLTGDALVAPLSWEINF